MTWGNSINTVQQLKKLKALDRLATRSTTTITRNTPQASVEIMIDLMPIELMIQKTGISAYIRLKTQLATPFDTNTKIKPHLQSVSYTHLRAHETGRNLVCRLLLEKKKRTLI